MRVIRQEGPLKLFNGVEWASSRAVMVTIGQLCFYDIVKDKLLTFRHFEDNSITHVASSFVAVSSSTSSTMVAASKGMFMTGFLFNLGGNYL